MCFLLLVALLAFPRPSWANPAEDAVVTTSVANLYSSPSEDADVVSQAIFGTNVVPLEERDNWVKVRTPDEYTGWILRAALQPLGPDGHPYASAGRVAQVQNLAANVYREPSVTKHQPVLTVPFETRLEVIAEPADQDGRWLQVVLPDDRKAWIQRGDVTFDVSPLTIKQTLALAKHFQGVTYLWGGTSSFGYDCSGFTQMLIRRRGAVIPRDADMQAAWKGFVPVKQNKPKPGDLLFFGSSPDHITHSGMYIGGGKFIHDTPRGHPGVQISRLADRPWAKLLVACRRLK